MNENEYEHTRLTHHGVMGMHWGKVRARLNSAVSNAKARGAAFKEAGKVHVEATRNRADIAEALMAKRKNGFSAKMAKRMSDKEVNDLANSPAMAQHLSSFRQARKESAKRLVMTLAIFAVAYGTLAYGTGGPHKKMTINFDRRPRPADPFFKATIRKVVPKLLPGG